MFIIQYQYLQKEKWYDDPYFNNYDTIEETEKAYKDSKPSRHKFVRYRIIERFTIDKFKKSLDN